MILEVPRIEMEAYRVKAVAQGQQRSWTTWEGLVSCVVNWADICKMPQNWLSSLIRATGQHMTLCPAPEISISGLAVTNFAKREPGDERW